MEHPFAGDLSEKSSEELTEIISRLSKNMAYMARSGRYSVANQIQMMLESYRSELNRQQKQLLDDEEAITGKIDIS